MPSIKKLRPPPRTEPGAEPAEEPASGAGPASPIPETPRERAAPLACAAPEAAGGEEAARIAAQFGSGSAAERERGYQAVERAIAARAVELVDDCAQPLIAAVLCADESKVGQPESTRAFALLGSMIELAPVKVLVTTLRPGGPNVFSALPANCPGGALAKMHAKEPTTWTLEDAVMVGAYTCPFAHFWVNSQAITNEIPEYQVASGMPLWWQNYLKNPLMAAQTPTHFLPLALQVSHRPYCHFDNPASPFLLKKKEKYRPCLSQVLELLRNPAAAAAATTGGQQLEHNIILGAFQSFVNFNAGKTGLSTALLEAGILDVAMAYLKKYKPLERIAVGNTLAGVALYSVKDVLANVLQAVDRDGTSAGVVGKVLDSGIIDLMISSLVANQMMGDSESDRNVNPVFFWYGVTWPLAMFDYMSPEARPVIQKLRDIPGALKFVIDKPLKAGDHPGGPMDGCGTSNFGNMVAASVFGRDEDPNAIFHCKYSGHPIAHAILLNLQQYHTLPNM